MVPMAHWTKPSTRDESIHFIKRLALSHAVEGGKQGERITDYIVSGDLLSVCDFSVDYETASTHESRHCRQAIAFIAKCCFIDLGKDRRAVATNTFWESERLCKETNDIFRMRAQGSFTFEPWVDSVIHRAQRKIARVLGDVPKFSELNYRFGPGATTLTKKSRANNSEKLGVGISCSEDLLPYAHRILEEMPHLAEFHSSSGVYSRLSDRAECSLVDLVVTNDRLNFVPKNAKTDRCITVAPSLNLMVQLALGDYMSARLRAFGVDLKDQSRNQKLAFEGSLSGNYATLDLKSASDTISTEIVYELLPIDWALALDVCRSSKVEHEGKTIQLEKFSSMGNGFTFPLESLIFWALSSSAADDDFASVYGDDIIVTTGSVERVMRILQVFGFQLNKEKSFWTGPFRESCGADFIRGIDIRPYYQKELISGAELFRLHNYYVRHLDDERAEFILNFIHPSLRIYGPDGFGDGHLLGDWIPRPHKRAKTHGYGGVLFDTFKHKGNVDERTLRPGDRLLPVYSTYVSESSLGEPVLSEDFSQRTLGSLTGFLGRQRKFQTYIASEPIPERVSPVNGVSYKTLTFPGVSGYKRVSIYTFSTGASPRPLL